MYGLICYLLQPYVLVLLLLGTALGRLWYKRPEQRRGLFWLVVAFLLLIVLSTPAVSHLAVASLEWQITSQEERPQDAEAIVVLDAGGDVPDRWRERPELSPTSLYRTLHAARLYHQASPCLLLLAGGKLDPDTPGPPFVDVMAELLVQQGVRPGDVLVESKSRSTYENAVECRKLLEQRGIRRIVLVTDALHLPRAVRCFRKQGFEVVPSGCHPQATEFQLSMYQFLPAVRAVNHVHEAAHEWIGLAWYWLAGRI